LPPRPRLESLLDGALAHRLTVLVADAGFGKTTLLASWSAGINAVGYQLTDRDRELGQLWRQLVAALRRHLSELPDVAADTPPGPASAHSDRTRPQAMAELLGHSLEQRLTRDLVLVVDDAHRVTAGPAASFLAGLVRHAPPLLHLVFATRGPLPVPVRRLRAQGQLLEVSGAELAFTTGEVAALLSEVVGAEAAGLAEPVRLTTGGWPMAVRLAVEALRELDPAQRSRWLAGPADPQGRLTGLIRAAYQQEPAPVRRLLAVGTLFDRFTAGLGEALGVPNAAEVVADLARRGLFVEPDADDWYRLHPLARRFVAEQAPLPAGEAAGWHRTAARWFTDHGLPQAALRSLLATGDHDRVAKLLARTGEQLATGGHGDVVIDAIGSLPPALRGPELEQLAGHAYLFRGEWDEALARYTRAAEGHRRLPAGLAWRIGLIHYLRGDHERALATYQRAEVGADQSRDAALVLAWAAAAHWIRGDPKACGELAARALRIATEVDDPAALAAAHTVLSMLAAMEGDRRANAAHYAKALQYAQRAGDVLQLIRIHTNRASHSLEEGTHATAMTELDLAIRFSDLYGYGAFGGVALTNRAQIRLRLGQLEEAQHDAEAALAIFEDLGSRKAAYPLTQLGHLHHLRGDRAASARAYQQALDHVAQSGDRQAEVPALAGLARLLAESDPARAESLAEQAVACGDGLGYVEALLAAGRVGLARGDHQLATEQARAARAVAESRRDRAGVAEAEELAAAATGDPAAARALAGRAAARWAELADPIGQARAELVRAERLDDPASRSAAVESVRARLGTLGCRLLVARADELLATVAMPVAADRPVRVETLGAFRLIRAGAVLPAAGWRSRKARDVLKILLARRGRPVTREFLMEALWPGEPPAPLANRLHVAVSTLRSVLDPEREHPGDAFVVTDDDTVRLRLDRLEVDVEAFLADVSAGMALGGGGASQRGAGGELGGGGASQRLVRAESRYGGDFLEEDLYQDWAAPLREQARAAYIAVAGRLAERAVVAGDVDTAVRYLLRMLEYDPYDEQAHLRLVSTLAGSGRHGDARRHYRHYCARMDELEIEAAPFPV
jgi:ATP/maltotriose-dependent transcriptional regulator MalT/DNA-binding SARP family transcriptional activator